MKNCPCCDVMPLYETPHDFTALKSNDNISWMLVNYLIYFVFEMGDFSLNLVATRVFCVDLNNVTYCQPLYHLHCQVLIWRAIRKQTSHCLIIIQTTPFKLTISSKVSMDMLNVFCLFALICLFIALCWTYVSLWSILSPGK